MLKMLRNSTRKWDFTKNLFFLNGWHFLQALNPAFLRAFETVRFRWQFFRQSIHDQMTNMVERERKWQKDRPVNIGTSQPAKNPNLSRLISNLSRLKWSSKRNSVCSFSTVFYSFTTARSTSLHLHTFSQSSLAYISLLASRDIHEQRSIFAINLSLKKDVCPPHTTQVTPMQISAC
jgi:hypothetical protein